MKQTPKLQIFDVRQDPGLGPVRFRELPKSDYGGGVPVKTLWGFNDEVILSGNDNGGLYVWDVNSLEELHRNESAHDKQINDMQVFTTFIRSKIWTKITSLRQSRTH